MPSFSARSGAGSHSITANQINDTCNGEDVFAQPNSYAMSMTGLSNAALEEELEAVNAIYGSHTATVVGLNPSIDTTKDNEVESIAKIVLSIPDRSLAFFLSFSSDYPVSVPQVDGIQSAGKLEKGQGAEAVSALKEVLQKVWTPGAVCLYDLIEEVGPILQNRFCSSGRLASTGSRDPDDIDDVVFGSGDPQKSKGAALPDKLVDSSANEVGEERASLKHQGNDAKIDQTKAKYSEAPWHISSAVNEKKSVFVARCITIKSKSDLNHHLDHLLTTEKKVASATHNIAAWRIRKVNTSPTNHSHQQGDSLSHSDHGAQLKEEDFTSDGESSAGHRLLHLLQLMNLWDLVVVVSRWYGGIKLGPDRFRLINQVAREAILLLQSSMMRLDGDDGDEMRGMGKGRGILVGEEEEEKDGEEDGRRIRRKKKKNTVSGKKEKG